MDGAEGGKHSRPCVVPAVERFERSAVRKFFQLGAERCDRVAVGPGAVVGEETAGLGSEQEDDPHNDGDRGLVEPVLGDVLEKLPARVVVCAVEGADEQLDGASCLEPELVGDFAFVVA